MASIRKRGNSWQARVARKGFPPETRTFRSKTEAQEWCRETESSMDRGSHVDRRSAQDPLCELLKRYRGSVSPLKRGARDEAIRISALERTRMAGLALENVTPGVVAAFRDARLKQCKPETVIRDLAVLSSIFNHARREWGYAIQNPVALVRKPPAGRGRERVLCADEEKALLHYAQGADRRNPLMAPLLVLALETGMRRGELLSLRWNDIDLVRRTALLRTTKNGQSRRVPLSSRAVNVLLEVPQLEPTVFPWGVAALHKAFRRLCTRAGIQDLRFHDLRHTATSRLATKLPNVIELSAVTGHQSLQMLKRYYHPTAEALAEKIG